MADISTFTSARFNFSILSLIGSLVFSFVGGMYFDMNNPHPATGAICIIWASLCLLGFLVGIVVVGKNGEISIGSTPTRELKSETQILLDKNFKFWIKNKEQITSVWGRKIILIHNQRVVGAFDRMEDAYHTGVKDYGLGFFLIQDTQEERPIPSPGLVITEGIRPKKVGE